MYYELTGTVEFPFELELDTPDIVVKNGYVKVYCDNDPDSFAFAIHALGGRGRLFAYGMDEGYRMFPSMVFELGEQFTSYYVWFKTKENAPIDECLSLELKPDRYFYPEDYAISFWMDALKDAGYEEQAKILSELLDELERLKDENGV